MTRILLAILALTSAAMAHSWYPPDCCSDQDCKPINCIELIETRDGFEFDGVSFDKKAERASHDRHCHVCISKAGKGLCVFTLQGT